MTTLQVVQLIECGDNSAPEVSLHTASRFAFVDAHQRMTLSVSMASDTRIAPFLLSDPVQRADTALQHQLAMIGSMQAWRTLEVHDHPQLTSEPDA